MYRFTLFTLLFAVSVFVQTVSAQEIPQNMQPISGLSWDFSHGKLRVSDDHRSIICEDGTPFLYLGDTAWELLHRLTKEETEFFLEKRRSQGFTVIQTVALAEFDGLTLPTPDGYLPLQDKNPAKPAVKDGADNDYWDNVDFVIQAAEKKGLYIGLLPTWGDKVLKKWRGEEIFTPENAEQYGFFIGSKYGNKPNIIWILGGDRPCERDSDYAAWRAMVKGIKNGELSADGGFAHLMTYHPMGSNSSSKWFHKDGWLDFNMFQSGHGTKNNPNYKMVLNDWNLQPPKPVLDGEPRYENHPVRGDKTNKNWFDDFDIRQAAYWSIFAGSFGHTYGCHDIWMMYDGTPQRQCADARTPWNKSVDLSGAWQMLHLRRFLLDNHLLDTGRIYLPELIKSSNSDDIGYAAACCTKDRKKFFVYVPTGKTITLNTEILGEDKLKCSLFNPRDGRTESIELKNWTADFPADEVRGNDWVLIISKISKL
ncbi:MAG: glycoside hydrolase family 140 protein [Planctomycetaceae bacterium]|jgi:hypothetical protein|nr:glycoside hydrolase family 140 protein [Planctomycetaceae bacterium]